MLQIAAKYRHGVSRSEPNRNDDERNFVMERGLFPRNLSRFVSDWSRAGVTKSVGFVKTCNRILKFYPSCLEPVVTETFFFERGSVQFSVLGG